MRIVAARSGYTGLFAGSTPDCAKSRFFVRVTCFGHIDRCDSSKRMAEMWRVENRPIARNALGGFINGCHQSVKLFPPIGAVPI